MNSHYSIFTTYQPFKPQEYCFDGNARTLMAKLGFRYGVGFPTAKLFNGTMCALNPNFIGFAYVGPGTIFSSETDCVPACGNICSRKQCSQGFRTNRVTVLSYLIVCILLYRFTQII
jgi:hypothetical protein